MATSDPFVRVTPLALVIGCLLACACWACDELWLHVPHWAELVGGGFCGLIGAASSLWWHWPELVKELPT